MTTPTPLTAKLAEIRARAELPMAPVTKRRDIRFLLDLIERLGDEKVVEAAAQAMWERITPNTWAPQSKAVKDTFRDDYRAALSAALTAAMQMEGKDG